ncbi:hypothetical protein ACQ4PT_035100 [Festuca glaucescens]
MPTEMPLGLPFVVDTWGSSSSRRRRHHFLTHAHTDHLANAQAYPGDTVYATKLTMRLALQRVPQLERGAFVEMELGKRLVVRDPDGDFSVTAYDANHCPGAVMFLFEGQFGNILHTGDCRLTSNFVQNLPLKGQENNCRLDNVYLDCTFSEFPMFPSKELAIQQVIACILKHPHAPFVYLYCQKLGHEEILIEVSRAFGSKIYLDRGWNLDYFDTLSLTVPEIITDDPTCRFQIVGDNQFKEIKETKHEETRTSRQPEPLLIRPSALWYDCAYGQNKKPSLTEAEQDDFGVWRICFSIHSSRDELEQALQILQPHWVISTTPPNFANELSYVRKHCLAHITQENVPLSINFRSTSFEKEVYEDFVRRIPFSGKSPRVVEICETWVDHRTFGLSMRVNGHISEHCMNMMGQAIMSERSDAAFAMRVLHSEYAKMLQDPFQYQENISDDLTEQNQGYKLDNMDAVFMPLQMCKTWYLVVANFWKKRFEVLSPLGYTNELIREARSMVYNFQEAFHNAYLGSRRVKIKAMDITFHTISNSDNESDSGIFIMKALDLYDLDKHIFFKDSDAKGLREHLTFYLLDHKYNEKTPIMYKD